MRQRARRSTQPLDVMSELRARIQESAPERILRSQAELDLTLDQAAAQAQAANMLNIIFLTAPSGNELALVVGGDETVLSFVYHHCNPPYFASSGSATNVEPVLTAFAGLEHHTEFSRRCVIPMSEGRRAASQFLATGALPAVVEWVEV
jgi:hypothetical protein